MARSPEVGQWAFRVSSLTEIGKGSIVRPRNHGWSSAVAGGPWDRKGRRENRGTMADFGNLEQELEKIYQDGGDKVPGIDD